MRRRTPGQIALAGWLLFAVTGQIQAGLIPAAVTVTPDGGDFRYKYNIQLPSDYRVKSGDFFTIYDFHGYTGAPTVQPPGWTFSITPTGEFPPRILLPDDPTVPNMTWTYEGPDLVTAGSIGIFEILSSFGPHSVDTYFASQAHLDVSGRANTNWTFVSAPDPITPDAPEPTSLALLGLAIPAVGLTSWLRRRRRV